MVGKPSLIGKVRFARYPIRISDWRIDPSNHPNLTFWMLVPRVLGVGRLGSPATIYPLGESYVL
jgi:hypothetical protein